MKKGVSPLIATVLIIGFTILIASVIMIWGTDFIKAMQKSAQESALKSITCTSNVGVMIKHACVEGKIGVRLLIENYGNIDVESFNVRIYGDEGVSSNRMPHNLVTGAIKLLTTNYDAEEIGTVEKVEIMPNILYQGEEVSCSNINERTKDFSGCELSELQMLACEEADAGDTCNKLADIGLVTIKECQGVGFCL